jgi:hypothetical protein
MQRLKAAFDHSSYSIAKKIVDASLGHPRPCLP